PQTFDRIRDLKRQIGNRPVRIQVDGGIKASNAAEIVEAGATVLVAGSAVFGGNKSVGENVKALQRAIA
ncbi:MAG: ribulose-phosphate 3-epimerase, partial [Anaerolineales bacterium]|nr:ribulose-phosphate 3-epimerase [Anaerolineales bacterium]